MTKWHYFAYYYQIIDNANTTSAALLYHTQENQRNKPLIFESSFLQNLHEVFTFAVLRNGMIFLVSLEAGKHFAVYSTNVFVIQQLTNQEATHEIYQTHAFLPDHMCFYGRSFPSPSGRCLRNQQEED